MDVVVQQSISQEDFQMSHKKTFKNTFEEFAAKQTEGIPGLCFKLMANLLMGEPHVSITEYAAITSSRRVTCLLVSNQEWTHKEIHLA